jgi:Lrp/AsnC family leucine-responsive transcriptional regulator
MTIAIGLGSVTIASVCFASSAAAAKPGTHAATLLVGITSCSARIDPKKLGLDLYAFVHATINASKYTEFETAVLRHPSILQCFSTAGEADYVMHVLVRDISALDELIRREIAHLPGVERTVTTVCMKTIKEHALIVGCL